MKSVIVVVSLALSLFAAKAEAGQFNINASSCVPDSSTVQNGLYHGQFGQITFEAGKTGVITLYCPVPYTLSFSPTWMSMMYSASANTGSDYVKLMWIKMNMSTGNIGTDAQMFNTSSSGTVVSQGTSITTSYLPASYAYWIRIDIARSSTSNTMVLYAVHLEG